MRTLFSGLGGVGAGVHMQPSQAKGLSAGGLDSGQLHPGAQGVDWPLHARVTNAACPFPRK